MKKEFVAAFVAASVLGGALTGVALEHVINPTPTPGETLVARLEAGCSPLLGVNTYSSVAAAEAQAKVLRLVAPQYGVSNIELYPIEVGGKVYLLAYGERCS